MKPLSALRKLLIGRPLASRELKHQRLPKILALPVFSSDAVSSSAYATDEILLALVAAGGMGLRYSVATGGAIVLLLVIVAISYRQTVYAYPKGGGSYSVSRENLGVGFGLTAASALLIDYVLTVSVSIAAGVAAITSPLPFLLPHKEALCLLCIAVVTLANLRGVRESGTLFAFPTYSFILSVGVLIVVGLVKVLTGTAPTYHPPQHPVAIGSEPVTLFLILRAFASGCAALTGVEAVSNGVRAFRPPESRNAAITLAWMAAILGFLFFGITILATSYGVIPSGTETVVSQIARTTFGRSGFYYFIQAATAAILIMAANTSFADFPRLSAILACDRFMPSQLSNLGDRLVFANGIFLLGGLSSALIVVFQGDTHRLIPLYAVGVFLSFTLSQAGMVRRWFRLRGRYWVVPALVNGLGAVTTAVVLTVIACVKFKHGAWLVVFLIPTLIAVMRWIYGHYVQVATELAADSFVPRGRTLRVKNLVLIPGVHRGILEALEYARLVYPDLEAVYVNLSPAKARAVTVVGRLGTQMQTHLESFAPVVQELRDRWKAVAPEVPLVVLESESGSLVGPICEYIDRLFAEEDCDRVLAILPEFVGKHNQQVFHNTLRILRRALTRRMHVDLRSLRFWVDRRDFAVSTREAPDSFKPLGRPPRTKNLLLIPGIHRGILEALEYARFAHPDLEAVFVNVNPGEGRPVTVLGRRGTGVQTQIEVYAPLVQELRERWQRVAPDVPLVVVESEFRSLVQPVCDYIERLLTQQHYDRVLVILPEFVPKHRRQRILHNQSGILLRMALSKKIHVDLCSVRYFLQK